jgi:hypothetical protein
MDKEDMKFMYIPGQEWNYVRVNGMLPFYAYLHRMFRKTLAPWEGDQSNVSNYGRDLLKHMSPSEPTFSVVDYIWEEIYTISGSPQKSCGYSLISCMSLRQSPTTHFDMIMSISLST